MCGLVGIFDPQGKAPIDRLLLERMNSTQRHRGPDGDGMHVAPGIGLASTRLAIIDLAAGAQPMFNEDASVVVVYNGAIYNFRDLQEELRARGHAFRSACDTEVIVHAWEEWGEACVTAPARDVRVRALGCPAADPVPGARPAGHQAAALRHPSGRPAPVRLRAEGPAGAPGPAAAHRPVRRGGLPRVRLCARPEDDLSGCPQAAARPLALLARRPKRAARGALLAAMLRSTRGPPGIARGRGASGAPGRGGGDAPRRRRAAWRLSVRRHRLQHRGRHDEPDRGRAREHLLDRLRSTRLRRNRPSPGRSRRPAIPDTASDGCACTMWR